MEAAVIPVPVVLVALIVGWVVHRRRAAARTPLVVLEEDPTPSVHVLRSDDELRVAFERAAQFDNEVAIAYGQRAGRYQSMARRHLAPVRRDEAGPLAS